jgi:hypothetical protein
MRKLLVHAGARVRQITPGEAWWVRLGTIDMLEASLPYPPETGIIVASGTITVLCGLRRHHVGVVYADEIGVATGTMGGDEADRGPYGGSEAQLHHDGNSRMICRFRIELQAKFQTFRFWS